MFSGRIEGVRTAESAMIDIYAIMQCMDMKNGTDVRVILSRPHNEKLLFHGRISDIRGELNLKTGNNRLVSIPYTKIKHLHRREIAE